MIYLTTGAKTITAANGLLVQVNAALTGTLTLSSAVGGTFAIITNPVVGSQYRYNGLRGQGVITITSNATCDVTISLLNREV